MNRTSFGFFLFACICSISIHTVVGFGETCIDDTNCTQISEVCNQTCVCDTSKNYINIESQCVLKADLGASCTGTICLDPNAECGSYKTCVCKSSHYDTDGTQNIGGSCALKVELGIHGCSTGVTDSCNSTNAQCNSSGYCTCDNGYYDNNGGNTNGGTCTAKVELGSSGCSTAVQDSCKSSNAQCNGGTCKCNDGYYDDNGFNAGGSCKAKVELGSSGCSTAVQDSCKSSNAQCNGGTCKCNDGYYDDNGFNAGGSCKAKVELGSDGCSTAVQDSCKSSNARCSYSGGACECNDGYYDNNGNSYGGSCIARKDLGSSCSNFKDECADSAAQCLDSKCTCGPNHYDSNGFDAGGSCDNIRNLEVKEISFPRDSVTTSGFRVSWTQPDSSSSVNSYLIDWRLKTKDNSLNGGIGEVTSSGTFFVIRSGVTAGKTYTVTVTSKNNQTQSNSPRTTSLSKEQAAKPDKPGAINKSSSDLHASAGYPGITLYWARPSGGVSGYKVTLYYATNTSSLEPVSEGVTFNPTWLKNGHRYNVTIRAKSETYEGANVVLSEVYREEIKTVVTVPDAPRSVTCKDIFDQSIVLAWQIPSEPNGDLVRYTINVYDSNEMYLFNTSTAEVTYTHTIKNLKPGTPYTFRVYTENEKFKSTTFGEKGCQTKAKLSDAPSNLQVDNMLITSRSFTVLWDEPNNTYSQENYGYVIQVRLGEQCIKEVVYRCIDCRPESRPSSLENMCDTSIREVINITKANLVGSQSWQVLSLLPDTTYIISATAVNSEGRGNVAEITQTTYEEVPQTPFSVDVSEITSTSFMVKWSINDPRPGKTNFTLYITADSPAPSKEITVTGFATRSKLVDNLEEFWNYVVSVKASTSKGSKISSQTARQQTLSAAPGHVSDFQITNAPGGNYTQMKVTWKAPEILQRNSIIKEYNFEYYSDENSRFPQSFQHKTTDSHVYTVFVDVRPEITYTVQVFAVNEQNQTGSETEETRKAPAGVPINIEETQKLDIIPKESVKNRGETKFTVSITERFFTESTYGDIRKTGLVACVGQCGNLNIKTLSQFDSMDNWKKARTSTYRVTEAEWLEKAKTTAAGARRKREVTELEYTVGSDSCSNVGEDDYCNGPLQPDTRYMLRAVSCTNGGCLVSKEYGPFITLAVPDKSSLGMIVGIVVAVVVVLAVVAVIGFIMIRRRKRGPGGMKPAPTDDDEEFSGIDPAIAKIPRKRPVILNDIEEYVTNMHKDSNLLFSSEYEDLKTLSPKHSCEAADREENRMRNRYINIIPFDHSRVKLSTNGEDDSSDYINANYLPGYTSPREYIGCQGPIPGTIDDFWRMVWEQNVSVIVMLTLCKEGQKIKCEQYWPDDVGEPKQYGDVVVEITSYSNIRTYDYRMFKITSGNKTRVIKHFHFLSWLDFQANVHHDIILDFIQHVRQHVQPPDTSGPMIIHCSAGVGRTGTYIVLDHLMQFINEHDFDVSIDIFDMVLKLRDNRMHMVQTEQQYVFIHDCVKEIMDRKRRETDNIYVNEAFSSDENIYQNESLYANVAKGNSEQNTEL